MNEEFLANLFQGVIEKSEYLNTRRMPIEHGMQNSRVTLRVKIF